MNAAIRLLHLENEPTDAERLRLRLQADYPACEVVWVRGKEDFESRLKAEPFDFVLCNYQLPGYSGLQALRHVREHQPELPVIVSSAGMSEEDEEECVKAGATAFVLKQRPWWLGALLRALIERAALRRPGEELRALNAELEARVRARTAELETANRFLNSVIQYIPHMVIVKRADDLTTYRVNRAIEEMLGQPEQELLGKTVYDFFSREEGDFLTAKDREALALGKELDVPEESLHAKDGRVRVLHARKVPIPDESGRPGYLLTIAEDVTERRKKEREIETLNAALAQRSVEVEAANRAKSTFLATMSHEIRTPMNGMLGMLELLSLTDLDAEQRETLGVVRASSKSLLRIIDDILDFSKIEAGKLDIRPEVVSIRKVIEEVHSIYLGNASSKGLIVKRMVDPRISPGLWTDPVRLRQILNNFVSNAIKFTSEGSIEISAEWVGRSEGQESLRFMVKDSGIGISQEDQQRLFQPFSQAMVGDEARRSSGGTGLGLVISRQLAQMLGGSISMASESGKGTTLTLSLTLPIVDSPPSDDVEIGRAAPASTPIRRVAPSIVQAEKERTLVLLVDDHPVNRMLLLRQVQTLGYAAETAEHGVEALEMWKSGRFGLVITDCHMPQMDGYELARSIRRLESVENRKRVPIVACTANALQQEAEACRAAGMDDCLIKPVELSQLTNKLRQWLPIPLDPAAAAGTEGTDPTPAVNPIDQTLLMKNCGGYAAMVSEVLAAFRRTCEEDAAVLKKALAEKDAARVMQAAHRMAGASKTMGALGFAAACEQIDRASRAGDWKEILAAMPAFEREWLRLAAYFNQVPAN